LLKLKNVKVRYGPLEVLHGIDLEVNQSEIICLLGSNAAGKSTLVNAVLGIVRLSGGEIWFRGERIDNLRPGEIIARGFAVVPEGGQIFTDLTVLENLRMGLYLKTSKFGTDTALEKMFALYPVLKERLRQKAGLMSGGERQMLAMARALISDPSMLILDSPSMGLAPKFVHQQFKLLRDLNAHRDMTVLVVEQNANMALALSHRGYVLQNGEIALQGDAKQLLGNEQIRLAYLT
jgi:branched-chain amino acid transport system ATP-binding protein